MKRKDITLPADMYAQINMLTNEDLGQLVKGLYAFAYDDLEFSTDNETLLQVFASLKAPIDAEKRKAEEVSRKRADAVRARWSRQKDADTKEGFCNTKDTNCMICNTKVEFCNTKTGFCNTKEPFCITLQEETKVEKENSPTPPIKNKDQKKEEELLQKRARNFYDCLVPFVGQYGREMMREFYDYWSEPNKSRTKMRYELEKTWDITRRLRTWASRRTNRYGQNTAVAQQQRAQDAADIIASLAAEEG